MSLDQMSLDDLMVLTDTLGALVAAGRVLQDAGYACVFDLSPGYPMAVQLDVMMPPVGGGEFEDAGEPVLVERAAPDLPPAPAFVVVPAVVAAPDDVGPGPLWTKAEDALALKVYAEQMHLHAAKGRAVAAAAEAVGRPFGGTNQRLKTYLRAEKARIDAEVIAPHKPRVTKAAAPVKATATPTPKAEPVAAAKPVPPPAATPKPAPPPAPKPAPEPQRSAPPATDIWADAPAQPKPRPVAQVAPPAPAAAPAPAPAPVPTDLVAHLAALPRPRGWVAEGDADLISMACDGFDGFDMAAIAVDLGVDAGMVKARFDALTGLHRDDNNKPVRQYTREALRDHLCRPAQAAE